MSGLTHDNGDHETDSIEGLWATKLTGAIIGCLTREGALNVIVEANTYEFTTRDGNTLKIEIKLKK